GRAPCTAMPRKRVAALMAELERAQGDEGRGREWMARALNARRDPAWTADAFVSDHWLPISPVSGRLDAFEWKDPLAGEDHGAVIEHRADVPATVETSDVGKAAALGVTSPRSRGEVDARSASGEGPPSAASSQQAPHPPPLPAGGEREPAQQADKPASEEKEKAQRAAEEAAHADPFSAGGRSERRAMAATADESRAPRGRAMPAVAPAVIPLGHAPDDPRPNRGTQAQPAPQPAPPPPDGPSPPPPPLPP